MSETKTVLIILFIFIFWENYFSNLFLMCSFFHQKNERKIANKFYIYFDSIQFLQKEAETKKMKNMIHKSVLNE